MADQRTATTQFPAGESAEEKLERHRRESERRIEGIQQDGRQAAGQASRKTKETVHSAREQAQEATEQVANAAAEQAERAREEGAAMFDEQKHRVAEEVAVFGTALRRAAETLHEEEDHAIAGYAERAAEGVERISGGLRDRSGAQLMHDAEDLARKRPELVFGGLFVAGLGIARFLKSSSSRRRGAGAHDVPARRFD